MSNFVPEKDVLRGSLITFFHLKKTAAESYRLLVEAYGEHALTQKTCERWFKRFKSGDFDIKDKERPGQPKKFENADLQALLDKDSTQTLKQLAKALNVTQSTISERLHALGKIQKEGKWVPYELKERDIERRKTTCEILLARQKRKDFLYRVVTGDKKWIYFDNPKRRKSWVEPGQPSTSQPVRNIRGKKALLCIWWDSRGTVYYELLKPGETISGDRYRQQLIKLNQALKQKRPEYAQRHNKVIFQYDNARPHVAKCVKKYLENITWDVLPHLPYSPDLAPSDYHLLRSMQHGLSEQHLQSYEEVKIWLDRRLSSKDEKFFWSGIHSLPKR